mgnify:CR=1 FL=1
MILGENLAGKLAAHPLVAGEQDLPRPEDRERERERGRGEHPYIDWHPDRLLQFLRERQLIPERVSKSGAAMHEGNGNIDIAEGALQKGAVHVRKQDLLSLLQPGGEKGTKMLFLFRGDVPGSHWRVVAAGR